MENEMIGFGFAADDLWKLKGAARTMNLTFEKLIFHSH